MIAFTELYRGQNHYQRLDDLIAIYFGQDYYLFDDSEEVEPKIDAFLAASQKGIQLAIIDDIDLFLQKA